MVLAAKARSRNDLRPVLETLVETALRLCVAYDVTILMRKGDWLVVGANKGPVGGGGELRFAVRRGTAIGRAIVAVPFLRHDDAIGVIVVRRSTSKLRRPSRRDGILMSYGFDGRVAWRRAASHVDRISRAPIRPSNWTGFTSSST
jgi:hypothetical protein